MSRWTQEFLNRMRDTGDELADSTVREIFKNKTREERDEAIHRVVKHPLHLEKLDPALATYFSTLDAQEFTEEDIKAFDKSVEIFDQHGFRIFLLLFFKSLPTGYLAPKPGHVLATTQLLVNQATRRVFETAIYIMAVMKKDWYKPDENGNPSRNLRMLEKLRFLHSCMRVQIQDDRDWDTKKYGVPINQEDEVLTLQLFSLAIIRGLNEMGITLSREEKHAWFHAWRRIGRILGIREDLEPQSIKDGWALQNSIYKRQFTMPNQDGPALTNALLTVMINLSNDRIGLDSLEKITRYFLYHTKGMSLKKVTKSLGMKSKPSATEYIIDHIVYVLVNWDIWDLLFHRHEKPSFMVRWIRRSLAHRLGLGHMHNEANPTEEVLDTMVKEMLANLVKDQNQKSYHHRAFELDKKHIDAWGLGAWDYIDNDSEMQ